MRTTRYREGRRIARGKHMMCACAKFLVMILGHGSNKAYCGFLPLSLLSSTPPPWTSSNVYFPVVGNHNRASLHRKSNRMYGNWACAPPEALAATDNYCTSKSDVFALG